MFLQKQLEIATASSRKDPHGVVKLCKKALTHLRACQQGLPADLLRDDEAVKCVILKGREATTAYRQR